MRLCKLFVVNVTILLWAFCCFAKPEIHFDFESDTEGWDVPDWAMEQEDHVGKILEVSDEKALKGDKSLKLICAFPGSEWTAGVVEYVMDMDLSGYKSISADIFLPKEAKGGLYKARIILVAGPWWIIEQRYPVPLKTGQWTEVTAKLDVTPEEELMFWKRKTIEASLPANINNVRKIVIRIEYDANPSHAGPPYEGAVYIDNIAIK
ncbi:MAG: hypothetical protein PHW46_03895 [Candidatus Omnitrophica bacterium]|nr:hypothetical protein [Candidatus Omnitrophota bacterium]